MTPCGFVSCECLSIACSAAILFVLHLFDDQDISPMCEGHVPPFTLGLEISKDFGTNQRVFLNHPTSFL